MVQIYSALVRTIQQATNHYLKQWWSGLLTHTHPQWFNRILSGCFSGSTYCNAVVKNVSNHWGRVTHICIDELWQHCSDNGLSPGRRQTIIWTNAGLLSIGTIFNEIVVEIYIKMSMKISSWKWRPSCLGLNVLTKWWHLIILNPPSPTLSISKLVFPPHKYLITEGSWPTGGWMGGWFVGYVYLN